MEWGDQRLPKHFWERAKVSDEHWLWTDSVWSNGYGQFKIGGISYRVHRLVYWLAVKCPDLNVLHRCDIKVCFRPEHLYEGTQKQNVADALERGLHPVGSRSGASRLVEDDIREIRRLYATGQYRQEDIARMFGVNQSNVSHIVLRRAWRHVE